jgi:hypothetical protein
MKIDADRSSDRRVIMGANIAGIYGAQIFRSDDSPRYRRGFGINIGVITLSLSLAILRWVDDKWWRKPEENQPSSNEEASEDTGENDSERGREEEKRKPAVAF